MCVFLCVAYLYHDRVMAESGIPHVHACYARLGDLGSAAGAVGHVPAGQCGHGIRPHYWITK